MVNFNLRGICPERLDILHNNLAFVDVGAELFLDLKGNFLGGNRTEQLSVLSRLRADLDGFPIELLAEFPCEPLLFLHLMYLGSLFVFKLGDNLRAHRDPWLAKRPTRPSMSSS